MSVITGISVGAQQIPPAIVAAGSNNAASQAQTASQPPTTSSNTAQPAVVISLSSSAAAQVSSAPRSMDPDQVDDALAHLSGANGFAFIYAHWDYAGDVARFGEAIADRNEALMRGGVVGSASRALSAASGLGISASDSVSPSAVQNGAAPGTITVAAFSFTNGGATYSVAPGANGTLVGTRDGQAWQTWQLIPTGTPGNLPSAANTDSGAATAPQTLTSLNAQLASKGRQSLPLDILG
jgi:hypothetical protein